MKLLFVLPEYGSEVRGGIATFYRQQLPALINAGHQVDVCVASLHQTATADYQSEARIFWPAADLVRECRERLTHFALIPTLQAQLSVAYAAHQLCSGGQYDVVETTDWGLLHVPWLATSVGPPVVVQLHGSVGQVDFFDPVEGGELSGTIARLLETALLPRADELQSCGRSNAENWARLLNRNVRHIFPAWVSDGADDVTTSEVASAAGLTVGRIQAWKGPEVLCQAARLLGHSCPTMLWVGTDTASREHRSVSDMLRRKYPDVWGKALQPIGQRSRLETASLQRSAQFVVIPSTWDVFNLAAVEAMDAGKIIICSEGAGVADLITPGVNGFRFAAADARTLADHIVTVERLSTDKRAEIGAAAKATIAKALDPSVIATARTMAYARVVRSGSARQQHPWYDQLFGWRSHELPLLALDRVPLRALLKYLSGRVIDRARIEGNKIRRREVRGVERRSVFEQSDSYIGQTRSGKEG